MEHPVTEAVRNVLAARRQERKDTWESGQILELSKDEQVLRNAAAVGECQAYKWLQEMTLEQLKGEMDDAADKE